MMNNKKNWRDCGNILSKNAKKFDTNYVWGVRFYVLLLECFFTWSLMDQQRFGSNNEKFYESVPQVEENQQFYYHINIDQINDSNNQLDKLLKEGGNSRQSESNPPQQQSK